MIYAEKRYKRRGGTNRIEDVTYSQAFIIGCFQCLAILFPGFSRSAATIIGGWIAGLSTFAAAEFSFFLALPTMVVASVYSLVKADFAIFGTEFISLVLGFIVSFIVAIIVVDKFISYLKQKPMLGFAQYRIVLGALILALAYANLI